MIDRAQLALFCSRCAAAPPVRTGLCPACYRTRCTPAPGLLAIAIPCSFATAAYAAAAVFSLRTAIARPSLHGSNSNPLKPPLSRFCAPLIPNTLNHETLASTIRRAWSPSAPPAMREWHKLASARVSTGEQNPEAQLFALREYASRRRFSIFKEYVDHVSGHVERRRAKRRNDRAYRELMEDASRRSSIASWFGNTTGSRAP
jgi:hypothetical protein